MATPVELPQLGNTVEECLITRWITRKGEPVSAGDVIAEIETDKTSFEITAPVGGTVLELFFEEGSLVPVFSNLCVIGQVGETVDAFRPGSAPVTTPALDTSSNHPITQSPNHPIAQSPNHPITQPPTHPLAHSPIHPITQFPISPRARRFIAERDFHPSSIAGSGPGGRVLERDVRAAYDASRRASPARRLSSTRDTIARRMRESLASTAQYTLHASAVATALLTLRARIKASPDRSDITINDLVTFCTIRALVDVPALNAHLIDGSIVNHSDVHIAFACDTSKGLMAPVIRSAQTLSIGELASRMKELADLAVAGTISPDDLAGATFTISNLGGLGIEWFTPILNPPQVAILGVGAIQPAPMRAEGQVEFIDTIRLSLTCDHQIIDGAPGARFLRVLKEKIEAVEALCPRQT